MSAPDVSKNSDWFVLPENCKIVRGDISYQLWNEQFYWSEVSIGFTTKQRNQLIFPKKMIVYRDRRKYS